MADGSISKARWIGENQGSAPGDSLTGKGMIYFDSNGNARNKNSAGTDTPLGQYQQGLVPLAKYEVGAGGITTVPITLTSLAYDCIEIVWMAGGTGTAGYYDFLRMKINGDGASHNFWSSYFQTGTPAAVDAATNAPFITLGFLADNATAKFHTGRLQIFNCLSTSSAFPKTIEGSHSLNGSYIFNHVGGHYNGTSVISSLEFFLYYVNISEGSKFWVYGRRQP
jgi:hypothetical protein